MVLSAPGLSCHPQSGSDETATYLLYRFANMSTAATLFDIHSFGASSFRTRLVYPPPLSPFPLAITE